MVHGIQNDIELETTAYTLLTTNEQLSGCKIVSSICSSVVYQPDKENQFKTLTNYIPYNKASRYISKVSFDSLPVSPTLFSIFKTTENVYR